MKKYSFLRRKYVHVPGSERIYKKGKQLFYKQDGQLYDLYRIPVGFVFKGNLDLSELKLKQLPDLSKTIVQGSFNCSKNRLTSLKGSPQIVQSDFNCSHNKLVSLEGAPRLVRDEFNCSHNFLTNLKGCCEKTNGEGGSCGSFRCEYNKLTSLEGAPAFVRDLFNCDHNELTTLKGGPLKTENYLVSNNRLISLEGIAKKTAGLDIDYNRLTELDFLPDTFDYLKAQYNSLESLEGLKGKYCSSIDVSHNKIRSMKGLSKEITVLNASFNSLTTLEYSPVKANYFNVSHNQLTSFKGAPTFIQRADFSYNEGLKNVDDFNTQIQEVLLLMGTSIKELSGGFRHQYIKGRVHLTEEDKERWEESNRSHPPFYQFSQPWPHFFPGKTEKLMGKKVIYNNIPLRPIIAHLLYGNKK